MAKLIPGLLQCAVAVMLFLLLVIMTLNHINIHIHITMETREPMHTTLLIFDSLDTSFGEDLHICPYPRKVGT